MAIRRLSTTSVSFSPSCTHRKGPTVQMI
jgi:hypothetical protein